MEGSRWMPAQLCQLQRRRIKHDSVQQSSEAGVLPNRIETRITCEPNKFRFMLLVCGGKKRDRTISIAQSE